jgi:hypothetical protein
VTWTFCWIETDTGVRYVRSPLSPPTVMMMTAAPGFMRPPTRPTQTRCDDVQAMLALDPEFFSRLAHSQSPKCGYLPHCYHLLLSLPPLFQCHGQPTCCCCGCWPLPADLWIGCCDSRVPCDQMFGV